MNYHSITLRIQQLFPHKQYTEDDLNFIFVEILLNSVCFKLIGNNREIFYKIVNHFNSYLPYGPSYGENYYNRLFNPRNLLRRNACGLLNYACSCCNPNWLCQVCYKHLVNPDTICPNSSCKAILHKT
jgi:hypothetical protein